MRERQQMKRTEETFDIEKEPINKVEATTNNDNNATNVDNEATFNKEKGTNKYREWRQISIHCNKNYQ
jgi:hypothetical protein